MKKHFLLGVAIWGSGAFASPDVDGRYALRALAVLTINQESENVHAQQVQSAMEKYFESRPRFELSTAARDAMRALPELFNGDLNTATEEQVFPWLSAAWAKGADSVIFAQVQQLGDQYQISFVATLFEPVQIVFRRVVPVRDRFALNSFTSAVEEGLGAFAQSLPFDASVVSREGYRVVLDRGAPSFRMGSRVPIFTLEKENDGIVLVETGLVQITRVDANLAFGNILVENKPREIAKGNKARFQVAGQSPVFTSVASRSPLGSGSRGRTIASLPESSSADYVFRKEKLGSLEVDLAASAITWNRTATDGTVSSSRNIYPGAALRSELKLTEDTFGELSALFGTAPLAGISSATNQVRVQAGYRLSLGGSGLGPSAHVRLGYSRTQFSTDDQPLVLAPSSATFAGVAWGGGFVFPITEKFGVGLDMTGLAFPSLTESGGTSGETSSNVTAWDFAVRGYYHFNANVNVQAKLLFQTHSANFAGTGTRTVPLSSLSQNMAALLTGISYYF